MKFQKKSGANAAFWFNGGWGVVNGEMNNNNIVFAIKAKQSLTYAHQVIARKS